MGCTCSQPNEAGARMAATSSTKFFHGQKRKMSRTRRIAVRVETNDDMSYEDMHMEAVSKTDEERAFITKATKKNEIFEHLTDDQVSFMIRGFTRLEIPEGELVISQGEAGDHFYIVVSGRYEASLSQLSGEVVAEYGGADSFGELALLYNAPRAATIRCTAGAPGGLASGLHGGVLWALERKRFRHVMVHTNASSLASKAEHFLKSVPMLSALTDAQRHALADVMDEVRYSDGEYLVTMGEVADALFFIKSGEVACHQGRASRAGDILRMKTGDVFGESFLEPTAEDAVRKANVVAVGPVTVLRLTAMAFREQLGNLQGDFLNKLQEKIIPPGGRCITQGNENDTFFVIKTGVARVLLDRGIQGMCSGPLEIATLTTGKFFGERALLKSEPASATIQAAGDQPLVCYTCDRDTFTAVLGPLQSLIDKEMQKRDKALNRPDAPKFGDLELRRILGVGTFGRVKLVVHKKTGETYALKCMRKAQVVAMRQQAHVLLEKEILSRMEHPFILKLVQTYQDEGELYMLEELALGGELFSVLAKRAPLFDGYAQFYIASVVSMFSYMHSLRVVYRDLKPENLLLDAQGYLKLVDFGFAKVLVDRTWTLCGTPEYLAPEIVLNKGHGFAADWWCVGILAFECLTGTTPFVSSDPMEAYRKIVKGRVPWPAQLTTNARDFIDRLLCVDPSHRLGSFKGGSKDVRNHGWFDGLDFKSLEAKQLAAPYVPKIKHALDDSNFDTYVDEGVLDYPQEDFPRDMFEEFAYEWV
ncbi:camp-dependent protein kinase catalytic [Chrysochromulina tobinii]|uniref:cGMP-dependent protein kinase n=1 Tax=Chrysochromulina tobinii TaxID=1460289 RepID=A0A0M0JHC9_9EUKA|nr:camp-dependent protein kinase catalytic [Chrysochromulina tobinii]|eukprot:KOO25648.1 camp-dependent protein kinase catalytic [Chrysochromulina sp. CCMP291]